MKNRQLSWVKRICIFAAALLLCSCGTTGEPMGTGSLVTNESMGTDPLVTNEPMGTGSLVQEDEKSRAAEAETAGVSGGDDSRADETVGDMAGKMPEDMAGKMPGETAGEKSSGDGASSDPLPDLKKPEETAEFAEFAADRLFASDLPDGDLEKPDGTISSLEDLIYILDYMAFYRVGDKIWFSVDETYASSFYNPFTEYQKAYEMSDLADVYACQMDDSYYSKFRVIGIKYSMSKDIASVPPEKITDTPVVPSFDYMKKCELQGADEDALDAGLEGSNEAEKADAAWQEEALPVQTSLAGSKAAEKADAARQEEPLPVETSLAGSKAAEKTDAVRQDAPFPIETSGLPEASCENGEQLYYLAMNGYRPMPKPGSIAETLYQAAKEAVFSCTDAQMSDFFKIKGVYDWLTTEVVYDAETAYTSETYLVREQAYYLEGVFLNRCAVCDGKSKACALMLNMLGIPCYRTTGVNAGGDHAWNMVQLDGKWYVLCTTYGQKNRSDTIGRIVPDYSMLLAGKETPYEWYPAQKHVDIEERLEEEPADIYGRMGEDDGQTGDEAERPAARSGGDEAERSVVRSGEDEAERSAARSGGDEAERSVVRSGEDEAERSAARSGGDEAERSVVQSGEDGSINLKPDGVPAVRELLLQAAGYGRKEYKVEFAYSGDDIDEFKEELTAYLESVGNAVAAEVPSKGNRVFQIIVMKER